MSNVGDYTSKPLHQRKSKSWFEDHDISQFMPKSTANIDVLAPMSLYDLDFKKLDEFLRPSIENKEFEHIIFPLGPGHWRAITLTKPTMNQSKFTLEIFDSYGQSSAKKVLPFLKDLLQRCDIAWENIHIKLTTAPVIQRDGYSCGDYTCAYSHQKMLNLGAPQQEVNMVLVHALQNGNDQDALRKSFLEQSKNPMLQVTPAAVVPHISTTVEPEKSIPPAMTEKPTEVVAHTTYNKHVEELLSMKETLFKRAKIARRKQKQNTPLSDEELATILQVEEIKKAGYR